MGDLWAVRATCLPTASPGKATRKRPGVREAVPPPQHSGNEHTYVICNMSLSPFNRHTYGTTATAVRVVLTSFQIFLRDDLSGNQSPSRPEFLIPTHQTVLPLQIQSDSRIPAASKDNDDDGWTSMTACHPVNRDPPFDSSPLFHRPMMKGKKVYCIYYLCTVRTAHELYRLGSTEYSLFTRTPEVWVRWRCFQMMDDHPKSGSWCVFFGSFNRKA